MLLLDEPLSALDAHTRDVVRSELQDLLAQLALPTLLVTHDFGDAAALADRIGVIVNGELRQFGTAAELIANPADPFVVSLTGGNLLPGTARSRPDATGSDVTLDTGTLVHSHTRLDGRVAVAIYPWEIHVSAPNGNADGPNTLTAPITAITPSAGRLRVRIGPLTAEITPEDLEQALLERGEPARATFNAADTRLLALRDD